MSIIEYMIEWAIADYTNSGRFLCVEKQIDLVWISVDSALMK